MKGVVLGIVLLAGSASAFAGDAPQPPLPRGQMEAGMFIDGEIEVDAQGRVERYTLNRSGEFSDKVRAFVDAHIRRWHFEPVVLDGQPRPMRNRMSLQLALTPLEGDTYRMSLRNSSFHASKEEGYTLESLDMTPPKYPAKAQERSMEAVVYLVLRVGRDGRVHEAMAEQVNLRTMSPTVEVPRWREIFASNAVDHARGWSFTVPTVGEEADDAFWDIRVPVTYAMGNQDEYGEWVRYVPGPRQAIPWRDGSDPGSPEALAAGGLYPLDPSSDTLRLARSPEVGG